MAKKAKRKKLDRAAAHFVRGLHARGEVALSKKLPAGATHELVQNKTNATPILRRRRFSLIG